MDLSLTSAIDLTMRYPIIGFGAVGAFAVGCKKYPKTTAAITTAILGVLYFNNSDYVFREVSERTSNKNILLFQLKYDFGKWINKEKQKILEKTTCVGDKIQNDCVYSFDKGISVNTKALETLVQSSSSKVSHKFTEIVDCCESKVWACCSLLQEIYKCTQDVGGITDKALDCIVNIGLPYQPAPFEALWVQAHFSEWNGKSKVPDLVAKQCYVKLSAPPDAVQFGQVIACIFQTVVAPVRNPLWPD